MRIRLVIHFTHNGIGFKYKTVTRTGKRYQKLGPNERETCLVRVFGQDVWAEKYPNTVWTVPVEIA